MTIRTAHNSERRFLVELLIVIMVVSAAVVIAVGLIRHGTTAHAATAPAHPISADTAYLTTLAANNIGITDPAAGIAMGHNVCKALDLGTNRWDVGMSIVNVGYQPHEAAVIVGASVASYCQDHAPSYANQRGY